MKRIVVGIFIAIFAVGMADAKLPPPTDEQKAKAEEAKAKAADAAKADAGLLAKAQDRVATRYILEMKAKGIEVKPTPLPPPPAPAGAPAAAPAVPGNAAGAAATAATAAATAKGTKAEKK